jgi:fructokinase
MSPSPPGSLRFGIDLGGTKTEILALGAGGRTLWQKRIPSPQGSYRATLDALAGLVEEAEASLGRRGSLGVGIPGAASPATGLVKNANSTWLIGQPLERDLSERLGRPVRLENDANCFALSEASDGASAGARTVFGAILGTGVGGGLVVDGRLLRGHNLVAGEWGHNPLPWPQPDELPGPRCYCGKHGCIEQWLSGGALAREGGPRAEEAAAAGDPRAEAALQRYEDRLARALATLINVFDPEAIVLGGGLSKLQRLYTNLPPRLPSYVFSDVCTTPIRPPKHGDASGVRGAAWLWPEDRSA